MAIVFPATLDNLSTDLTNATPMRDVHPTLLHNDERAAINELEKFLVGSPWVNAQAYGVVMDGVTDDTTAFAAAVAAVPAAGRLILPPGTLLLQNGTFISRDDITIEGAGVDQTTIKLGANATGNLLQFPSAATPTGITVRDLTLDGNKANQSADRHGLVFVTGTFFSVQNVTIKNAAGNGINLFACSDYEIAHVRIEDNGRTTSTNGTHAALLLHNASRGLITNVVIDGCSDMGIAILSSAGISEEVGIYNSVVRNAHWIGFALGNNGPNLAVVGCTAADITGNGFDGGACTGFTITGCVATRCEAGFIMDGASNYSVVGCSANDIVVAGGAYVSNGSGFSAGGPGNNFTFAGCTAEGCAGNGFNVSGAIDGAIVGCVARNNGQVFANSAGFNLFGNASEPCTNVLVVGCRSTDTQGTKTQAYGLQIGGTAANNHDHTIAWNDLRGNLTAALNNAAADTATVIRENRGYATRAYGAQASVADGGTIAHGLAITPTYVNAQATVAGEFASVMAVSATTITVAIKTHAGAAGTTQTIRWEAAG